jgi:hypothetical protein
VTGLAKFLTIRPRPTLYSNVSLTRHRRSGTATTRFRQGSKASAERGQESRKRALFLLFGWQEGRLSVVIRGSRCQRTSSTPYAQPGQRCKQDNSFALETTKYSVVIQLNVS